LEASRGVSWRFGLTRPILALGVVLVACPATAQQPTTGVARIGQLQSGPLGPATRRALREGLADLGWIEGRDLGREVRTVDDSGQTLSSLATELVRARVQVIVAANTYAVRAAKEATAAIPIVGIGVLESLVGSLAHPESNVTGLVTIPPESRGKQIEALKEAVPRISHVAYIAEAPPGSPELAASVAEIGRSLRLTLLPFGVRAPPEIQAALREALGRRVDALAVVDTPLLSDHRTEIVAFATKHRLPSVAMFSAFVESGFLMSYGTNIPQLYRRAAYYVDRLLKGARPGDLPVEQPTQFDLVLNLKTAKALGLTIPPSVLARTSRVIE